MRLISAASPAATPTKVAARQARHRQLGAAPRSASRSTCSRWPPSCCSSTRARRATPATAFCEPDRYFRQFEADFEFDETPDQQKAIDDVLADMQKPEPMDRLVCGDVGYGKTEVAMRAAFKAVLDSKQVAVLVPTTVLAQQHYQSFKKRFDGLPGDHRGRRRACASRGEVREVAQRAPARARSTSSSAPTSCSAATSASRTSGCWSIDEEQRFGVKQKEQLKKLQDPGRRADADRDADSAHAQHVDVGPARHVASSPRRPPTGARSAPSSTSSTRQQIREAILREIQRGGQVFFVHNRVASIHAMEKFLSELVPERHASASRTGRWAKAQLEKVMLEFVEKKHQVLLCTTHHRERHRHLARQHDDRQPRRHVRPGAALPAARPRRPHARSARTPTCWCPRERR